MANTKYIIIGIIMVLIPYFFLFTPTGSNFIIDLFGISFVVTLSGLLYLSGVIGFFVIIRGVFN